MCVEHLKRCKTSNLLVRFFENFVLILVIKLSQQGGNLMFAADCPTKRAAFMTDMTRWDAGVTYLLFQFCRQWQLAKPSTGMSVFQLFSNQTIVRFSQSELLLTSSDGTVASSKDVERILLHCFSRLVIHFLLSGLTEVFLHVRCVPHQ